MNAAALPCSFLLALRSTVFANGSYYDATLNFDIAAKEPTAALVAHTILLGNEGTWIMLTMP